MIWHIWIKNTLNFVLCSSLFLPISCGGQNKKPEKSLQSNVSEYNHLAPVTGANQMDKYLSILKNKRIALVANQTSVVSRKSKFIDTTNWNRNFEKHIHLADTLQKLGIDIRKVFAPEHGFRGTADAGAAIKNGVDQKTGLKIISLYGVNKKPSPKDMADLDLLVFDIQDVGARFYTYLSTLHYVMEACAEQNIPLLLLDRPNPNAHYIDGPVLENAFKSFVGMHPVPIVYGMTLGEFAQMINGELWLANQTQCDLSVIHINHYSHQTVYHLPIAPSPNLPSKQSIALYPSLCLFEGTPISAGRGTSMPFELFGRPGLNTEDYTFSFTPVERPGARRPKFKNEICQGYDLSQIKAPDYIELEWLSEMYTAANQVESFFSPFFDKLAGTDKLRKQLSQGLDTEAIRASWKKDIESFQGIRAKYLIYAE